MKKQVLGFIIGAIFLTNMCGCIALVATTAAVGAGAGTTVWISGKLTQEVGASLEKTVEGAKFALTSLKLDIRKETVTEKVAQVISSYYDGRTIWIDIHRISQTMSKVAVRVGAKGDKEAARKIMDALIKYSS